MVRFLILIVLFVSSFQLPLPPLHLRSSSSSDFDVVPFPPYEDDLVVWEVRDTVESTGREFVGHMAIFHISTLSFQPPDEDGCTSYSKTSITASANNCSYATNGEK